MKILKIGEKILRAKIKQLSKKEIRKPVFRGLVRRMVQTMRRARGVGLAANQVGMNRLLMVLECHSNRRYPRRPDFPLQAYVNLKILKFSKKKIKDWEGCLSIPGYRGLVPRSQKIWIKALNPTGESVRRAVTGFEARVIQHEADHLSGRFYIDRMPDLKTWRHVDE